MLWFVVAVYILAAPLCDQRNIFFLFMFEGQNENDERRHVSAK
jgi:hypothetical protein